MIKNNKDKFEQKLIDNDLKYQRAHDDNRAEFFIQIDLDNAGSVVFLVMFLDNDVAMVAPELITDVTNNRTIVLDHINELNIKHPYAKFVLDDNCIRASMFLPFRDHFCEEMVLYGIFKVAVAVEQEYRGLMKAVWS